MTRIVVNDNNIGQLPDGQDVVAPLTFPDALARLQLGHDGLVSSTSTYESDAFPFTPAGRTPFSNDRSVIHSDWDGDSHECFEFNANFQPEDYSSCKPESSTKFTTAFRQAHDMADRATNLPSGVAEGGAMPNLPTDLSNVWDVGIPVHGAPDCSATEPPWATYPSADEEVTMAANNSSNVHGPIEHAVSLTLRPHVLPSRWKATTDVRTSNRPNEQEKEHRTVEKFTTPVALLSMKQEVSSIDTEFGIGAETGMSLTQALRFGITRVMRHKTARGSQSELRALLREQNRVAAQKCRERRIRKIKDLQVIYRNTKTENIKLHTLVHTLESEKGHLNSLVLEHVNCGDMS